jgi:hypothetical protein
VESLPLSGSKMESMMSAAESAMIGFALVAAGIGLMLWGYRHHGTWLEGEKPPREGHYSVHRPPSAPGIKRIVVGAVMLVAGVIVLVKL